MLLDRQAEQRELDLLVQQAAAGTSGSVVLRGEPGIGKTALLGYAAERAGSMRILRATGFEAEAELAFGGLYALLRPLAGRLDARPRRYAALQAALGLASHDAAPGRLAVAVATHELLVTAAEQQPLLLLLDDLQCASRAPRLLGFAPFRGCCVALSAGFPAAVQLLGLSARAAAIAPARSSACPSASFAGVSFRTTRHGVWHDDRRYRPVANRGDCHAARDRDEGQRGCHR